MDAPMLWSKMNLFLWITCYRAYTVTFSYYVIGFRSVVTLGIFSPVSVFRDLEIPGDFTYFAHKEQRSSTAVTGPVFWKRTDGFEPRLESICTVSRDPLWCLSEGPEKQWSFLISLGPLPPGRPRKLFGPWDESVPGGEHWSHQQWQSHPWNPVAAFDPQMQVLVGKSWPVSPQWSLLGDLLARRPSPV